MRRSFAVSGLCHVGLLVALALWAPARTTAPRAPAAVFVCDGVPEPTEISREPDAPPEPPEQSLPDPWSHDEQPSEVIERVDPTDDWDAQKTEAVRLTTAHEVDVRRLCVRLKTPLRDPRRPKVQATPAAAVAKSAPRPPAIRGVTRKPVLPGQPPGIPYPRRARRRGLEGTVELKFLVTREGSVERVSIVRSSGHEVLDKAAKAAIARWRFSPALRNGVPVAAWTGRVIRFRLKVPPAASPRH